MTEPPKPRVLIVEPDHVLAASLRAAIRITGYDTVEAPDVEAALKLVFGGAQFHAILVAYLQPRLSGADFCALFRSIDDREDVRLVGMSRDHRVFQEMIDAGADDFVTKPFTMARLNEALLRKPITDPTPNP